MCADGWAGLEGEAFGGWIWANLSGSPAAGLPRSSGCSLGNQSSGGLGIARSGKEGCGDLKCSWTSRMLDWTEC